MSETHPYPIFPQPPHSFRLEINLETGGHRIDSVLLERLKEQDRCVALKNISRSALKKLFKDRKIQIKGQSAVPSSTLAAGVTFVDVLGFE